MRAIKRLTALPLLLALLATVGCDSSSTDDGFLRFTGTVKAFYPGDYVIAADDGVTYEPRNLAASFQREGLRVRVVAEDLGPQPTVLEVGPVVEIKEIEALR